MNRIVQARKANAAPGAAEVSIFSKMKGWGDARV